MRDQQAEPALKPAAAAQRPAAAFLLTKQQTKDFKII